MNNHPTASQTASQTSFQLTVQRIEQICLFTLSWEQGRQLTAQLPFPLLLTQRYHDWQTAYLNFYQTVQIPLTPVHEGDGLRGKAVGGGSAIAPQKDLRIKLVEAESRLLYDFHQWLRSPALHDIRAQIAQESRSLTEDTQCIDLFLTCTPIDIARLPWESWEIGTEFAATGNIRIARSPANIRTHTAVPPRKLRRRPRILAILGDDTRLNIQGDRHAVQSLKTLAEVVVVGWHPGQDIEALKAEIVRAIADEQGWDILFFAGHSNEKANLGGELAIAPNTAIALNEIKPYLQTAQQRGLQFALFNSCNGMDLAETLIDLGLSQVAVMREPIHNRVAQEFLVRFLQSLASYQDVHTALISATEFLKTKANLTHPSAHLIPALFRHPDSPLFRLQPSGWKQKLRALLPTRYEAIALSLLLLASWQLPVQTWLLERRVLTQAIYRQITQRVRPQDVPPVLLVRIDDASLDAAGITDPNPISRHYLSQLIGQLAIHQPDVIGIDYLLDREHPETSALRRVVRESITQDINFVFAANYDDGQWLYARPEIANGSPAGDMRTWKHHMNLPYLPGMDGIAASNAPLPLSYALVDAFQPEQLHASRAQRFPLTALSYSLGQRWFDRIIDYSLPPEQVYQVIAARSLESLTPSDVQNIDQQIVLIAPGGYAEAGIEEGEDNFSPPLAVRHWYMQANPEDRHREMTGGEVHAYQTHHLLRQRLVISVPDVWMILLATLLGKLTIAGLMSLPGTHSGQLTSGTASSRLDKTSPTPSTTRHIILLASGTVAYSFLSLELYLSSAAILLPIVFPVVTIWAYAMNRFMPKP